MSELAKVSTLPRHPNTISGAFSAVTMRAAVAGLLFCLGGCAGMDQAMQYEGITPIEFDSGGSTWRIFDKPPDGKVMITPTIGESVSEGLLSGLTFGAADTEIPKSVYQAAVADWLRHTRRNCKITDGYKLIKPQWEFTYDCSNAASR